MLAGSVDAAWRSRGSSGGDSRRGRARPACRRREPAALLLGCQGAVDRPGLLFARSTGRAGALLLRGALWCLIRRAGRCDVCPPAEGALGVRGPARSCQPRQGRVGRDRRAVAPSHRRESPRPGPPTPDPVRVSTPQGRWGTSRVVRDGLTGLRRFLPGVALGRAGACSLREDHPRCDIEGFAEKG